MTLPKRCKSVDEQLVDFLYDELPPAQRRAYEAHLDDCPSCAAKVTGFQETQAAFEQLPEVRPAPELTFHILDEARRAVAQREAAARPEPRGGFWRRWMLTPALGTAFAMLLVVGVMVALQSQHREGSHTETPDQPPFATADDKADGRGPAAAPAAARPGLAKLPAEQPDPAPAPRTAAPPRGGVGNAAVAVAELEKPREAARTRSRGRREAGDEAIRRRRGGAKRAPRSRQIAGKDAARPAPAARRDNEARGSAVDDLLSSLSFRQGRRASGGARPVASQGGNAADGLSETEETTQRKPDRSAAATSAGMPGREAVVSDKAALHVSRPASGPAPVQAPKQQAPLPPLGANVATGAAPSVDLDDQAASLESAAPLAGGGAWARRPPAPAATPAKKPRRSQPAAARPATPPPPKPTAAPEPAAAPERAGPPKEEQAVRLSAAVGAESQGGGVAAPPAAPADVASLDANAFMPSAGEGISTPSGAAPSPSAPPEEVLSQQRLERALSFDSLSGSNMDRALASRRGVPVQHEGRLQAAREGEAGDEEGVASQAPAPGALAAASRPEPVPGEAAVEDKSAEEDAATPMALAQPRMPAQRRKAASKRAAASRIAKVKGAAAARSDGPGTLNRLAQERFGRGEFDAALKAYTQLEASRSPEYAFEAAHGRARSLERLGQLEQAIRAYEDLVRRFPHQASSRQTTATLAQLYERRGAFEMAARLWRSYRQRWPEDPVGRQAARRMAARQGKARAARRARPADGRVYMLDEAAEPAEAQPAAEPPAAAPMPADAVVE